MFGKSTSKLLFIGPRHSTPLCHNAAVIVVVVVVVVVVVIVVVVPDISIAANEVSGFSPPRNRRPSLRSTVGPGLCGGSSLPHCSRPKLQTPAMEGEQQDSMVSNSLFSAVLSVMIDPTCYVR
ncbi:hypothetical protein PoB_006134600 [Plakobranchus ocellatus]|uniref:Uncharacterized protein n=1 Tax=Plakobranchus ocellatus TaxID=259542 RepID=A0AAV4CSI3_9GAST|nr:hypothetical protein PoB_006134600 [Plakobranchus ocellatus]